MKKLPESIDGFAVIELLGKGTYASSYLIKHPEYEDPIVLKLMHKGLDEQAPKRFKNEATALDKLTHKNIPKYLGDGIYKGSPYLLMSLAPGKPLGDLNQSATKTGNPVGFITILKIVEQLLIVVKYIQSRKLNHRDIKLDNVIYDSTSGAVTLIDFGFSQANFLPFQDLTFWNAGASRFSPPNKLEHPSSNDPSHDVFSIGVLAYLLSTSRYPWSAPSQGDSSTLKNLMRTEVPSKISQVNSFVPDNVNDFFHSLIIIDDRARPKASSALKTCQQLQRKIADGYRTSNRNKDKSVYSRVIRCQLHGDVNFTEYEWRLISTPEFNRLRFLKQLGATHLVYPGATHSRFAHALGAVHCANKIIDSLERVGGNHFSPQDKSIVRLYALMHDISHIAYGHTLEDELQIFKRHDANFDRLQRLLYSSNSQAGEKLRSTDEGNIVLSLLNPANNLNEYAWASEIVTSPIGADVLDYIDRDSDCCGLEHRVDTAIFRRFQLQQSKTQRKEHVAATLYGKHGVRLDAEFAVNSILLQRYALFLKVYTHPVKVAAGAMIGKAVALSLHGGSRPIALSEDKIEQMSDEELELKLVSSRKQDISTIAKMVRRRVIFKAIYRSRVIPKDADIAHYNIFVGEIANIGILDPKTRLELETRIASKTKVKSYQIILHCNPQAPGKKRFLQRVETNQGLGEIRQQSYDWHIQMMKYHIGLWNIFAFIDPSIPIPKQLEIAEEVAKLFARPNEINSPRRQLAMF